MQQDWPSVTMIGGGSAAFRVCSAFSPMKPKHSGKNSICAPCRFAQPAHLATWSRLARLSLVNRSWATAARRAMTTAEDVEVVVAMTAAAAEEMIVAALRRVPAQCAASAIEML